MDDEDICHTFGHQVKSIGNMFCMFGKSERFILYLLVAFCFISIGLSIYLLFKSHVKRRAMLSPTPDCHYDETYCELSLHQIYIIQIVLLLIITIQLIYLFLCFSGNDFGKLFYSKDGRECKEGFVTFSLI